MFLIILFGVTQANFITCPQLYTGRSVCEAETGCVYYDWTIPTCYYDCSQYAQQDCLLLFNCKWTDSECRFKTCLDYTDQGKNTCANTPGCSWFWNKCRQQNCADLGVKTQASCSKTFCNWDETSTSCINKDCSSYSKTICQQLTRCSWESDTCVDVVSSFELLLFISTLLLLF